MMHDGPKNIIDKLNEFEHLDVKWHFPETGREIPAAELCARVDRATLQLVEYGIGPGDRVGLLLDNSLDYVILLFATWVNRSIAVPLQLRAGRSVDYRAYLYHFHQICEFRVLFYDDERLRGTLDELAQLVDGTAVKADCLDPSTEPVAEPIRKCAAYPEDLTCFLQFSSGSTGQPKAVEVTHGMIMAQVDAIVHNHNKHVSGVTQAEHLETATWLPFSHNMGLFNGVVYPIFVGSTNTIVTPAFYMTDPVAWYRLVSQRRIELNFVTSSIHAMALRPLARLAGDELDLSCLQVYLGGESISPIVIRRTEESLARFNFTPSQVHLGYGLSEHTLSATSSKRGPIATHYFLYGEGNSIKKVAADTPGAIALCSIGEANHNCEMTIRDDEGKVLPDLVLGEINLAGPCVMKGYFRNPELTARVVENGRLKTGDLGFACDDEFFYHSRKDDLVIIAGRNLVPDDIELAVEALDCVADGGAVLVMVADDATGQNKPVLLYEAAGEPSELELREQRKLIQKAIYARCELLVATVVALPAGGVMRTPTGKKKRKAVRRWHLDERAPEGTDE